jgi:hypothetical protein
MGRWGDGGEGGSRRRARKTCPPAVRFLGGERLTCEVTFRAATSHRTRDIAPVICLGVARTTPRADGGASPPRMTPRLRGRRGVGRPAIVLAELAGEASARREVTRPCANAIFSSVSQRSGCRPFYDGYAQHGEHFEHAVLRADGRRGPALATLEEEALPPQRGDFYFDYTWVVVGGGLLNSAP